MMQLDTIYQIPLILTVILLLYLSRSILRLKSKTFLDNFIFLEMIIIFILSLVLTKYIYLILITVIILILFTDNIIKVKKYKLFKTRYLILIELITLFICGSLSYITFLVERNNIEMQINTNMKTTCNKLSWDKLTDVSPNKYQGYLLEDFTSDYDAFQKYFPYYYFYLEVENDSGEVSTYSFQLEDSYNGTSYQDTSSNDFSYLVTKFELLYSHNNTYERANKILDSLTIDKTSQSEFYDGRTFLGIYKARSGMINDYYYTFIVYADSAYITLFNSSFYNIACLIFIYIHSFVAAILSIFAKYAIKKKNFEATRDLFINAMAQEMKTPTKIIENNSELLKEDTSIDSQGQYYEIIHDEAIVLNDLLQQMLTYIRTRDTYQLKLENVALLSLIHEIIKNYDIKQNLEIAVSPLDHILCDSRLMGVVIDNFISNAIRYSDGEISISFSNNTFKIYNSGSHLSKDELKHIWEPLYKGNRKQENTRTMGMGLAISANILRLHHFDYGTHQFEDGIEFYFIVK